MPIKHHNHSARTRCQGKLSFPRKQHNPDAVHGLFTFYVPCCYLTFCSLANSGVYKVLVAESIRGQQVRYYSQLRHAHIRMAVDLLVLDHHLAFTQSRSHTHYFNYC